MPVTNPSIFKQLDHIAIVVNDTDEALEVRRDRFGFPVLFSEAVNKGAVRLTHLDLGNAPLQLVQPLAAGHPLREWLAKNGPGLHHFCIKVDTIGAAITKAAQRGSPTARRPHQGAQGKRAAFIDKSATGGCAGGVDGQINHRASNIFYLLLFESGADWRFDGKWQMLNTQNSMNPDLTARVSKSALLASLPPEWAEDLMPAIRKAVAASGRKVVVLDDDPTGTQTVHDIPVLTEWSIETLRAEFANDFTACFILTNSRSLPPAEARQLNGEIARNLVEAAGTIVQASRLPQDRAGDSAEEGRRDACPTFVAVSRSDSTLRGHFPAEIEALSEVLGPFDGVLLVPFFETGGRHTINDVHYLAEDDWLVPVSETQFARDVTFGYGSANLRAWVEEKTGGRIPANDVASISIEAIRMGGPERIRDELTGLGGGRVCVVNIASSRDLQVFVLGALEAEANGRKFLYRTAASFAAVRSGITPRPLLARAELGLDEPTPNPSQEGSSTARPVPLLGGARGGFVADRLMVRREERVSGGGLVVVGSYVPISSEQLEQLLASNRTVNLELDVRAVLSGDSRAGAIERISRSVNEALQRNQDTVLYTSRQLVTGPNPVESLSLCRRVSESLMEILGHVMVRPRFIIAKGGITSSDVATRALRVRRAMVLGQILPGVPLWRLGEEGRWPGLIYVSFPGNLGGPDALLEAVDKLAVVKG